MRKNNVHIFHSYHADVITVFISKLNHGYIIIQNLTEFNEVSHGDYMSLLVELKPVFIHI